MRRDRLHHLHRVVDHLYGSALPSVEEGGPCHDSPSAGRPEAHTALGGNPSVETVVHRIDLIIVQAIKRHFVGDFHGRAWNDIVLGINHPAVTLDDDLVDMGQIAIVQ